MKKFLVAVVASLTLFTSSSAFASQLIPPTPSWWPVGGFDLRHGAWIACNNGKWNTDDCVESIDYRPISGGDWHPLTFVPNPNFSPESTTQVIANNEPNDYAYLSQPDGLWQSENATNLANPELKVATDVGFFGTSFPDGSYGSWFSLTLQGQSWDTNISDQYQYKIRLKSSNLGSYARWSYSGSADAQFDWSAPGFFTFIGTPSMMYYPKTGTWNQTCQGLFSDSIAASQVNKINFTLFMWNNNKNEQPPSQYIAKTNGMLCMTGVSFDSSRNLLSIKVGTVKYDTSKHEILGWVDSEIDGNLLTNWWHIDPKTTRGQVQVEVTYSDGRKEAVATTATYNVSKNVLQVHSTGFHYPNAEVTLSVHPIQSSGSSTSTTGQTKSGAFVDANGVWTAFDDSFNSTAVVSALKNKKHSVTVNFGLTYANYHYALSIVELIKGKRTYTKVDNLTLDAKGRGSVILKNNLVPGSSVLASSVNRTAISNPVK